MKKLMILLVLVVMVLSFAVTVLAAPGGMPAAHEPDGGIFGGLVSGLAQEDPGFLAAHVSGR